MLPLLILLALIASFCVRCHRRISNPSLHYSSPVHCRSIIAAKAFPPMVQNELSPYMSRNLPSQDFKLAFAIDNAFTSMDGGYVKTFVKQAERLISCQPAEWKKISVCIHHAVRRSKNSILLDGSYVPLPSMIQAPTMQAILEILFPKWNGPIEHDKLAALAKAINDTWIASKNKNTFMKFEDNDQLQDALSAVFPDWNRSNPRENPLNWILPAFETMWRIVSRIFIEVRFMNGLHHPEWREILVEFSKDPTKNKLKAMYGGVSVEFLINEALRLYPPTKRIYRAWQWESSTRCEVITADIEKCHCSPDVWGSSSQDFDPVRWTSLTEEQKNGFLPFGSPPFLCPAKAIFGPTMIALLVGFLLVEFEEDWLLIRNDGQTILGHFDQRNDRNALDNAIMVRQ